MASNVVESYEGFFLVRIREGWIARPAVYASDDRELLLTPVNQLAGKKNLRPIFLPLFHNSLMALRNKYKLEVAKDPEVDQAWQKASSQMYLRSDRLLTCVVQHWYLTGAWGHEFGARRRPLYTWYSLPAQKIWDMYLVPPRPV